MAWAAANPHLIGHPASWKAQTRCMIAAATVGTPAMAYQPRNRVPSRPRVQATTPTVVQTAAAAPLWQAVVSGSAGGVMCTVVGHPFETVKVRLQMGHTKQLFRRLYVGVLSPVAGCTPMWAVGYFTFRSCNQLQSATRDPVLAGCISGGVTGLVKCCIRVPVDAVKVVAQNEHINTRQAFGKIWRRAGVRGVFKGGVATMIHMAPAQAVYFGTYTFFRQEGRLNIESDSLRFFMAGGLAGLAEWGSSMPLDTVKTRVQAGNYPSWLAAVRDVYATAGVRGFYRGFIPTMLRAFPANGAAWVGLEGVNTLFRNFW